MDKTVADRIRERRESLGLSQEDLAYKMGYSNKSSVCQIESSGDSVSLKKVEKCANALNTSVSTLMGWSNDTPYLNESVHEISIRNYIVDGASPFIDYSGVKFSDDQKILLQQYLFELVQLIDLDMNYDDVLMFKKYKKSSPEVQQAIRTLLRI